MNVEGAVDKFLLDNVGCFDPQVTTSASFRLGVVRAELVKLLKSTPREAVEEIGSGYAKVSIPRDAIVEAAECLDDNEATISRCRLAAERLRVWLI